MDSIPKLSQSPTTITPPPVPHLIPTNLPTQPIDFKTMPDLVPYKPDSDSDSDSKCGQTNYSIIPSLIEDSELDSDSDPDSKLESIPPQNDIILIGGQDGAYPHLATLISRKRYTSV